MKETFVKILMLDNEIDANLMKEELSMRNIPHIIRSYHDPAYNGLFQMQKGWGIILVPEDRKDAAAEIIEKLNEMDSTS